MPITTTIVYNSAGEKFKKEVHKDDEKTIINYNNGFPNDFDDLPAQTIIEGKVKRFRYFRNGYLYKTVTINSAFSEVIKTTVYENGDGPRVVIYRNNELFLEKDFYFKDEMVTEQEYLILKEQELLENMIPKNDTPTRKILKF